MQTSVSLSREAEKRTKEQTIKHGDINFFISLSHTHIMYTDRHIDGRYRHRKRRKVVDQCIEQQTMNPD